MSNHPLHTAAFIAAFEAHYAHRDINERRTGRSTALALKYISEAIAKPNQWVVIKDHFNHVKADAHLRIMMQEMVSKLGLKHMSFRNSAIGFGMQAAERPS